MAFEGNGSTSDPGAGLSLTALSPFLTMLDLQTHYGENGLSHTLGLPAATHKLGTGVQRDERHLVVWISTPDELCGVLV